MRKMYKLCFAAATAFLLGGLASCDPKDQDQETASADIVVNLPTSGQAAATSGDFKMSTQGIESYAYLIEEKADAKTPAPEFIYAEAKEIFPVKGGNEDVAIYGFEGSKTYTVHFAFKVSSENKYLAKSVTLTTGAFDRLLTIVELEHKAYKIHVNVPKDKYYRWVVSERYTYEDIKAQFGQSDLDFVKYGLQDQGPKTFYVKNGDILEERVDTDPWIAQIYPGMSMVALLAECDKDGKIDYEFTGGGGGGVLLSPDKVSGSKPNIGQYTEVFNEPEMTMTGFFARQYLFTKAPAKAEGTFNVQKRITERNATFKITPPASVKQYGVAFWEASTVVAIIERIGEDGLWEYLQRNMQPQTEPIEVSADDAMFMAKDVDYKLFIIGQTDKDGVVQIHQVEDFKLIDSDKPAVELVITQVTAPENSPYRVCFNVKAPDKNATVVKYLMNSTSEWVYYLNDGGTYEEQMGRYGNLIKDASALAEINSDAGHVLMFDSWENTENRLVLASYNEDEKEKFFVKDAKSLPELPKTKVESDLFTSLLGEWNVEYKFKDDGEGEKVFTANFTTKISNSPASSDPNFLTGNSLQYQDLLEYFIAQGKRKNEPDPEAYAKKMIESSYKEYNILTDNFKKKYREQNRLLLEGFEYRDSEMFMAFKYKSSWELFYNLSYSSYSTDQLFYDFGPKLFFEISEGNKVTLEVNPQFIAPCQNYLSWASLMMFGGNEEGTMNYFGNFDVEVVDANTLHIKTTRTVEGQDFLLTTYINTNGSAVRDSRAAADIVMTRKTGPTQAPRYAPYNGGGKIVNIDLPQSYKATAIDVIGSKPRKFVEVKIPLGQINSYKDLQKSYPYNRMK